MPELPEVETVVSDMRGQGLITTSIKDVTIAWPKTIDRPSTGDFSRKIRGRTIVDVYRRAKFIGLQLDDGWHVLIHLRMTGKLYLSDASQACSKHVHVVLSLDDGRQLRFNDTRKFGRWYMVEEPAEVLGHLGPEPLAEDFTWQVLRDLLERHKRQLKPFLLDQTKIAGLGNIYVDESLWQARLHPLQATHHISIPKCKRLHQAIQAVLHQGIQNLGTTLGGGDTNFYSVAGRRGRNSDNLNVFRRTGDPCPRCGTKIRRLIVGQRSSHICPRCQKVKP